MDDALGMQHLEGGEQMLNYLTCLGGRNSSTRAFHVFTERSRLVPLHHEVRGRVCVDHCVYAHQIRMQAFCERSAFEREPMQCAQEITLALRRVWTDRQSIRTARNETARKKFLDDDGFAR